MDKVEAYLAERCMCMGNCRIWKGPLSQSGHPAMMLANVRRKCMTRRVVYEMNKGPIPDGHVVVTTCGHRLCVHEDHLEAVPLLEARRRAAQAGAYRSQAGVINRTRGMRQRSSVSEETVLVVKTAATARQAQEATGLSLSYCYAIRNCEKRAPLVNPWRGLGA